MRKARNLRVLTESTGSTRNVEIHHIGGYDEHTEREHLAWCCRACQTKIGAAMVREGLERRTRQYSPASGGGALSLSQWLTTVLSMKGEGPMEPAAAEMVHVTPLER